MGTVPVTRWTTVRLQKPCASTSILAAGPAHLGAAVSHEDRPEAADGNRFAAFAATPDTPSKEGVVILPDVRGLYRFYEELALRFAERGIAATALDYFGRTAGIAKRDDDSRTWITSAAPTR
jgi:hypothetical protein